MAAANGTTRAGSVGSASPAGAMLRLPRLTLLPPVSCRELPKSRRSGGDMLISPVLFIVMQGAAVAREGVAFTSSIWICCGSPRPGVAADQYGQGRHTIAFAWRPFRQLSLCCGTTSVANHLRLIVSNVPSAMISFIAVLNFDARAVSSFRRPIPTPGPNSPPEIRGP